MLVENLVSTANVFIIPQSHSCLVGIYIYIEESEERLVSHALHGSVGIVFLSPDTDVFCTGTLLLGNVARYIPLDAL